jgi:hypothetical protein
MPRKILGSKMEEVTGGWRKMHNAVHDLYSAKNIINVIVPRRMKLVGPEACTGEEEKCMQGFCGKT